MLAADIPDGYLIAALTVIIGALFGFIGWIIRQILDTARTNERIVEKLDQIEARQADHEDRLRSLERVR